MVSDKNRNMVALLAMIIQAAEHVGNPRLRKDLRITNEQAVFEAIGMVQEAGKQLKTEGEEYDKRIETQITTEKLLRAELKIANERIRAFEASAALRRHAESIRDSLREGDFL